MSNCTHHWIIDSDNVGRCRYCPAVRDFGRLLQRGRVFVAAGSGAKARKEVLGKKRGRKKKKSVIITEKSATAKKLWQNAEYRFKQRAAHASLPGRHHKMEGLL